MSEQRLKPKIVSLFISIQFRNYSNNIDNCMESLNPCKWPEGFSCDHCGYH